MIAVTPPAAGHCAANDPPGVAAIEVEQVDLSRQGQPVLEQVSFSLMPTESLVITGGNGAGKSSLLRCLVEGHRLDAGRIRLFGRDIRDATARRRLAWLPERVLPPAAALGFEVLVWLGGQYGMRWSHAHARRLVASHGLSEALLERSAAGCSPGTLKMLGLIAALGSDRELLVLDEPFTGLDGRAREWWLARLLRLRDEQRTLVVAARSLDGIGGRVDRIVLLRGGRVLFEGSPAGLRARTGAWPHQDIGA